VSVTTWQMKHYGLDGGPVVGDYTGFPFASSTGDTEEIRNPRNRVWTQVHNSMDFMTFTLGLDHPHAALIEKKSSIIKMWRTINDVDHGKVHLPTPTQPDFAGIVVATKKSGAANTMDVTVMSPLWRLQTHIHIDNHHLVLDTSSPPAGTLGGNKDNQPWDHSALMWYLIDLVNGAFGVASRTGILKPTVGPDYWPRTLAMAPYYVAKGSNTWSNIFDDLMQRVGGADFAPTYFHTDNNPGLMYFKTAVARGSDRSSSVSFDYYTGAKNVDDVVEDAQVVPGKYGNYVWAVPDGGPNVYVAIAEDLTSISNVGIYMVLDEIPGAKKATVDNVKTAHLNAAKKADEPVYTITMAPGTTTYAGIDYFLGDIIALNADRGALNFSGKKQRIMQLALAISDNNMETPTVTLTHDFQSKVGTTT
jgi:hypothetical protein